MTKNFLEDLIDDEQEGFATDDLDELEDEIIEDAKVSPEVENRIAGLLNVNKAVIQEIVEVEPKIYVITIETNEDEFTTFSYSEVDDSIYEIPDITKSSKKQYLTEDEKTQYYIDNKRLITFALKKISRPDGIDFGELEDVGTFGFVKALNTYDKSNGTKFSTYAVKCVLNEVYYFLRKEQKHLLMTDSLDKEVATDNNGNSLTIGDTVSESISSHEKTIEQKIINEELRKVLLHCINDLQDDEQYLITYRYGLDNNIIKTQTEIAKTLNMSQANISKLEKTCLKKLRTILRRNNYIYDGKDKKLSINDLPNFNTLKVDDVDIYVDRDCRENIEVSICSLLNLDITDIKSIEPTTVDHTYLIKFIFNDRVGIIYNNIVNKYEYTAIPLNNKDKFLYMVSGVTLKSNFNKDDLLNESYCIDMTDKEFNKLIKKVDKQKQYILIHRYGLFDNPTKLCSQIAKDLGISDNEVYKLDREAIKEISTILKK